MYRAELYVSDETNFQLLQPKSWVQWARMMLRRRERPDCALSQEQIGELRDIIVSMGGFRIDQCQDQIGHPEEDERLFDEGVTFRFYTDDPEALVEPLIDWAGANWLSIVFLCRKDEG